MCLSGTLSVSAKENNSEIEQEEICEGTTIPEYMLPDTVIEYVSDTEYKILQGGKNSDPQISSNTFENARKDLLEKENIDIAKIKLEKEEAMEPVKGLIVRYADDGQILTVNYPDINNSRAASKCGNCGNYFTTGSPDEGENFMWGGKYDNANILYVASSKVYGYGRFTNFTDKTGQANHTMKKGDVATRGHVDNPKPGSYITCTAPAKGSGKKLTFTMQKWDIGCMPNAVLDIWYTGVEKWGYTWSSSLSISDGSYEYTK